MPSWSCGAGWLPELPFFLAAVIVHGDAVVNHLKNFTLYHRSNYFLTRVVGFCSWLGRQAERYCPVRSRHLKPMLQACDLGLLVPVLPLDERKAQVIDTRTTEMEALRGLGEVVRPDPISSLAHRTVGGPTAFRVTHSAA